MATAMVIVVIAIDTIDDDDDVYDNVPMRVGLMMTLALLATSYATMMANTM